MPYFDNAVSDFIHFLTSCQSLWPCTPYMTNITSLWDMKMTLPTFFNVNLHFQFFWRILFLVATATANQVVTANLQK